MLLFTAKINEDIGGEDGEDMITFDNNAGSDLSSSEDEDGPSKKDDFDLDDIDDVSITVWVTVVGTNYLIRETV